MELIKKIFFLFIFFSFYSCTLHSSKSLVKSLEISEIDSIKVRYIVMDSTQQKKTRTLGQLKDLYYNDTSSYSFLLHKEDINSNEYLINTLLDSLKSNVNHSTSNGNETTKWEECICYMASLIIYTNDNEEFIFFYEVEFTFQINGKSFWQYFGGGKSFEVYYSKRHYLEQKRASYIKPFLNNIIDYYNKKYSFNTSSLNESKKLPLIIGGNTPWR